MEAECHARLKALTEANADCLDAACWAAGQLPSAPPCTQQAGAGQGEYHVSEDADEEVAILRAQTQAALSDAGVAALIELLVTAVLHSSAQAAASARPPDGTAGGVQPCTPTPLLCTVTQLLVGDAALEDGPAAAPRWALAHLGMLWPGEVAGAAVAHVASSGERMASAAGTQITIKHSVLSSPVPVEQPGLKHVLIAWHELLVNTCTFLYSVNLQSPSQLSNQGRPFSCAVWTVQLRRRPCWAASPRRTPAQSPRSSSSCLAPAWRQRAAGRRRRAGMQGWQEPAWATWAQTLCYARWRRWRLAPLPLRRCMSAQRI